MQYFSEKLYKINNNNKYFSDIRYNKYNNKIESYLITDDDIKNRLILNNKIKNIIKYNTKKLNDEYTNKMSRICSCCGCIKSITGECLCD